MAEETDQAKDADQAKQAGAKSTGARAQLTEWARTALPAIASAIGISGLVSILGAGVLWVRFSAAHVPPEQAVGDLPAHSLLATGAVTLILYIVFGLLAVLASYMLQGAVLSRLVGDREDKDQQAYEKLMGRSAAVRSAWKAVEIARTADPLKALKRQRKLIQSRLEELRVQIRQAEAAASAAAVGAGGAAAETGADPATERTKHLREQEADLSAQAEVVAWRIHDWRQRTARGKGIARGGWGLVALVGAEAILVFLRTDVSPGWKALAVLLVIALASVAVEFEQTRLGRRSPPGAASKKTPWELWKDRVSEIRTKARAKDETTLMVLGGAVILVLVSAYIVLEETWIFVPLVVSLLLATAIWAVGRLHPRRFFWYGLTVFLSVLLFGATLTYSRTLHQPTAQAAAVLLKNGCVARGLWVGESSDRVFLAFVPLRRDAGRLKLGKGRVFWLSRKEVISENVGSLRHVADAERESRLLRAQAWRLSRVLAPGSAACRPTQAARDAEQAEEEGPSSHKKETVAEEAKKENEEDKNAQQEEEKEREGKTKKNGGGPSGGGGSSGGGGASGGNDGRRHCHNHRPSRRPLLGTGQARRPAAT
jgi:uncharacterized membrane protein YgcG